MFKNQFGHRLHNNREFSAHPAFLLSGMLQTCWWKFTINWVSDSKIMVGGLYVNQTSYEMGCSSLDCITVSSL